MSEEYVYLLAHLHIIDEEENWKNLGIFCSVEMARKAVDRLNKMPGFKDFPNIIEVYEDQEFDLVSGFYIDKYIINEDHWREGFITYHYNKPE